LVKENTGVGGIKQDFPLSEGGENRIRREEIETNIWGKRRYSKWGKEQLINYRQERKFSQSRGEDLISWTRKGTAT